MADLHHVVGEDPLALLEAAAGDLLRPRSPAADPFASPSCLLALRQGGLRDDLFELAASRGVAGWFDPPICVFAELPAWLGSTGRRPLGDFERRALLAHVIRTVSGPTFRGRESHFAGAADQLVGELRAEAVSPEAFAAAADLRGAGERFEQERNEELARIYEAYVHELDRTGCRDGRDTFADVTAAVRESPERTAGLLGGRREIRILGLADLRGGWRPLLAALVESPVIDRITIYTLSTSSLSIDLPYPVETVTAAAPSGLPTAPRVGVIAEPDPDRELEAVASHVRTVIDAGAAPYRIAIIPRQGRPYTARILRALSTAGVPARSRQRVAWRQIPCIRAVLALLEAAAEGWTRHGLAELGSQPYFRSDVDSRVINFIGYRERVAGLDAWSTALDQLLAEARAAESAAEDDTGRRLRALPVEWVEEAVERFGRFRTLAVAFEAERPVPDWLEWLGDWLERDPWEIERRIMDVPDGRWDVVRLDLTGWTGLRSIVTDWLTAERKWPGGDERIPVRTFLNRLRAMLEGEAVLWTGPARGVQVMEALAGSHRSFDHVYLVGMNAGRFPRRAPSSLLLGERDRETLHAAGLPLDTEGEWERRERALFQALVAGAQQTLTMSYTTLDEAGADAIPSSFLEELLAAGRAHPVEPRPLPFASMPAIGPHAHRAATIERLRATGRASSWNGLIEDPALRSWLAEQFGDAAIWSPTRIEEYAKCPWAWFSGRLLRLDRREDPDGDIDPRARGSLLHEALRRFYEAAGARAGGPVFLQPDDASWAQPLLRQALDDALGAAPAGFWLGHPALRAMKHRELEQMLLAFLAFEIEENRKSRDGRTTAGRMVRTAVAEHELAFDEVVLERAGVRFRFRGIIDRVEVGVDERAPGSWLAAVDYKTTVYACPGAGRSEAWDDGVVLQVPLYAWALSVLRPGAGVARVEYRAIRQARRVHALSPVRVGKDGVRENENDQARLDQALSRVAGHVRRIRLGEFPAAPAPSCHCPPFCHGWDICRVPGGPDTGRD